jgi:hypothetical protein
MGLGMGKGYLNLTPSDHFIHSMNAKGIKLGSPLSAYPQRLKGFDYQPYPTDAIKEWLSGDGDSIAIYKHKEGYLITSNRTNFPAQVVPTIKEAEEVLKKYTESRDESVKLNAMQLDTPTIELLASKDYDKKFHGEYASNEYGYAITKIKPDGEVNISVRDDGDIDRDGRLIMHELKEIEIYRDLVDNKGVSPQIADKLAHNLNPVKVEGVANEYPI